MELELVLELKLESAMETETETETYQEEQQQKFTIAVCTKVGYFTNAADVAIDQDRCRAGGVSISTSTGFSSGLGAWVGLVVGVSGVGGGGLRSHSDT
uniref:GG11369 n=1 Tax=Drosophila erecta TaxID=7220 RepID=B3P6Q8_DROER